MRLLVFTISALLSLLMAFGCAQKQAAPLQQDQQTSTTKDADTSKDKRPDADTSRQPKETITEKQIQPIQSDSTKTALKELQTVVKDIYFDFDRYDVDERAKPMLKKTSDILSANRKIKVIIEGHCDERGTREYNLGLGERRANSVKEHLISMGIPSKRIDTVSYGKEKPQCSDKTEECWAKNRRAHFVFMEEMQ